MIIQNKIYKTDKLTFIVEPEKIIVLTPLQSFYLEPKKHYWSRRVILIKRMIEVNEIRNLNELAEYCASQNVQWIPINRKFDVEKLEVVV